MYAKSFELYKLKRIISENYGKTRRLGDNAFHVRSKKDFLISMDAKIKSENTLKIFMYPVEYKIRICSDSTVRDVLEKLVFREFLEVKSKPKKIRRKGFPVGYNGEQLDRTKKRKSRKKRLNK